jgi:DNA-binding NtrC family response regulator
MDHMKATVLAIDNDALVLSGLKDLMARGGIDLDTAASGSEGIALISQHPDRYKAVLLDYEMPEMNGDVVARRLKEINPSLKIIMLSGTEDEAVVKSCYQAGAERFLIKAQDSSSKIFDALDSLVVEGELEEIDSSTDSRSELENANLINRVMKMKGCSRALANVARSVEKYGPSNENVLIQGESGVGKELVAKAIHANSSRAAGPFVAINCGAIPEDLLESELFGHERGAFTGAIQNKKGMFLLANKGTLFLDEIGDLKPSLQVKLLRAIQEKAIRPLGGQLTIKVDIRIITATHRDLSTLVSEGAFREDLYYRLKVLPILIPALRERPEDIEPLVKHFVALKELETGTKKKISDAAMKTLKSLPWPGNVRQLEANVKYAFINSVRVIQVESLEKEVISSARGRIEDLAKKKGLMSHPEFVRLTLEMEKSLLQEAMKTAGNVKSLAAELLGMSHQAMNYRRKKLGLDADLENKNTQMEV